MAILVIQLVSIFCLLLLSHLPQASTLALSIGPQIPSPNLVQPTLNHNISASNTLTVEQNIINLVRSLTPHPSPGISQPKLVYIMLRVDDNESLQPTLSSNIAQFRKIHLIFRSGEHPSSPLGFSIDNKWPSHWDQWNPTVPERVRRNGETLPWGFMFRRMSVEWVDVVLKAAGYALTIRPEGIFDRAPFDNPPAPLPDAHPTARLNTSESLEEPQIDCQGSRYGRNVMYNSCLNAFRTFQHGATDNPVDIRRRGPGMAARKLPWMWVSDDGLCTFNVVMRGRAASDTTTGEEIARAAWKVMNKCVRDQGVGGIISGIGQHDTLGIIIRPYNPSNVVCGSDPQSYEPTKCDALLNELPAETGPERTFGPRYQPGVDVPIPHAWRLACEYSSSVIQAT
ncbi:MAG: hypothetical protein Q9178_003453 [Gyalolechia marmorata]